MSATLSLTLRGPRIDEGAAMWSLARDSQRLDLNTPYAYMLWARDFHATTIVAVVDDELVGFVTAFWRQEEPSTLMVWQIAVSEDHRGHGIAGRMLDALIAQTGARTLETTITSANVASGRLFASFAARFGAEHTITDLFAEEHFPGEGAWEPELLHRISPLRALEPADRPTTLEEGTNR